MASTTRAATRPPSRGRAASVARRRPRRRARRAAPRAAPRDGDGDGDDARWMTLDAIHLLVFDLDDPDREALYTISRRRAHRASNAFVCFERVDDALRAAMAVSETARDMPAVDAAPPAALALLAASAGYDVEFVEAGAPFDAPRVVVDEGDARAGADLAARAADLAAYLRGDADDADARGDADDDADDDATRAARARAAATMRRALRAPATRVRDAAASSAALPVVGGRAYLRGAKEVARAFARATRENAARARRDGPPT